VIAGLTFQWGTDSVTDFEDPATLSAELLIRTPQDLSFLAHGAPFGLINSNGRTFFAGRVASMKAKADPAIKGALRISLTAIDTLADLEQYEVGPAKWGYTTDTWARITKLRESAPAGWTLDGELRLPEWGTAATVFKRRRWLGLLDDTLRGQTCRRFNTSRYLVGTGLAPRLTMSRERSKAGPAANNLVVRLSATNLAGDLEWQKRPEDAVTDVAIKVTAWYGKYDAGVLTNEWEPGTSYDLATERYVDTRPLQAAYGHHQLAIETDMRLEGPPPDDGSPAALIAGQVRDVINLYLETGIKWRPATITIADTSLVSDDTLRTLLQIEDRCRAYVIIDDLPPNTPVRTARVEAHVIGGEATWNGTKWELTLTLGRQTAAGGTPVAIGA
jgi:hypothetical protein